MLTRSQNVDIYLQSEADSPSYAVFSPINFFSTLMLEQKLLFINQLIVGWGGVGIGSIETNIEIYMLCVGNITGSLENTKHTNIKGEVLK